MLTLAIIFSAAILTTALLACFTSVCNRLESLQTELTRALVRLREEQAKAAYDITATLSKNHN